MTDDLKTQMAVRLARLSKVMGLDDEDEFMLWRYLAEMPQGMTVPSEVASVLINLAEESPHVVKAYQWTASMPTRFYTPKQKNLSRLGFHLRSSDQVTLSTPLVVNDLQHYRSVIDTKCRRACFQGWFDKVTACLREDGVNWEPPTDRDVELELKVISLDLREHLRQFV